MGVLGTLETTIRAILAAISDRSQVIRIPPSSMLQFGSRTKKKKLVKWQQVLQCCHHLTSFFLSACFLEHKNHLKVAASGCKIRGGAGAVFFLKTFRGLRQTFLWLSILSFVKENQYWASQFHLVFEKWISLS